MRRGLDLIHRVHLGKVTDLEDYTDQEGGTHRKGGVDREDGTGQKGGRDREDGAVTAGVESTLLPTFFGRRHVRSECLSIEADYFRSRLRRTFGGKRVLRREIGFRTEVSPVAVFVVQAVPSMC